MAIATRQSQKLVPAGGGAVTLHTGSGRVLAYLISHAQATAQTVTVYDNTAASGTILNRIHIAPEQCPIYIRFSQTSEDQEKAYTVPFTTGLTVNPGMFCDIHVSFVGY